MNDPIEIVAGVVTLNDGELVGKVRLQKTLYLLDACGLQSGFDYEFHFYGPFSVDLSRAADDATEVGRINFEDRFGYHEVPYRVFRASRNTPSPDRLGASSAAEIRQKLDVMKRYSAAELEIAASIVFLREHGHADDAEAETRRRKPATANRRSHCESPTADSATRALISQGARRSLELKRTEPSGHQTTEHLGRFCARERIA